LSSLLKKIFRNHSTRVLALLFAALLLIITYFLANSYFVQLNIHKSKILTKLEAIVNTAATKLDGNQIEYLFEMYPKEGMLSTNYQDKVYQNLHEKLLAVKEANKLTSAIYTLTYDSVYDHFLFGVSSSKRPFFRQPYEEYPKKLLLEYHKAGFIDVYGDRNGSWLSAFKSIKNSYGETVAVVQADYRFDEFLIDTRREIFYNIGISGAIVMIILLLLIRSMRKILRIEERLRNNLEASKIELEQKNKDTLDSIIYAKRIQEAILPPRRLLKEYIPDSFIFHSPRDIVSGDFYWYKEIKGKIFVACVDCTGHGVPGALMSMIGNVLLDDVISKKGVTQADEVLNQLHKGVVKALRQRVKSKASQDGMDIALCIIDKKSQELQFSGAFRPLLHISNKKSYRIRSTSVPIGGFRVEAPRFENYQIKYKEGDVFYICTDGYADQFSGLKNKKYMTRRFRQFLASISHMDMEKQKSALIDEFEAWRGNNEQVDDVLVMGFRL